MMMQRKNAANPSQWPARFTVLATALLFTTGCEEHKKLDGETSKLKEELKLLQPEEDKAQAEIQRLAAAYAALRDHTAIRKGGSSMEQKATTLTSEVNALKERKNGIQKTIDSLNQQASALRQKNP